MSTITATPASNLAGPGIAEVDRAVMSVLAAMRGGGERRNGRHLGAGVADVSVFAGRLLSLREVDSLPAGLAAVHVAPGTVVTPLARDALKRRGVEVRLASRAEANRVRNPGEWAFATAVESGLMAAVRRALLDEPEGWQELEGSIDDVAGWVAETEGRGALVFADESSVAVFRASRVPGVRAATASEPQAVARAVRALGMNVLVVEPSGLSIPLIRQLASTFRRGGGPVCPEGLY